MPYPYSISLSIKHPSLFVTKLGEFRLNSFGDGIVKVERLLGSNGKGIGEGLWREVLIARYGDWLNLNVNKI